MPAKPIVAGTDGSEESLRAVGWAAREAALRGAPLRIVAAAETPPGMISRAGPGEPERVTDVLLGERDQALAAAAERAAKTAPSVLIDTDPLRGPDIYSDLLTFAFEEASLRQASLLVVHAWHTPQIDFSRAGQAFTSPGEQADAADAARHLAGLLDDWRAKYPDVPVSQEVVHGHPGRALVGLSARADLVVVGRHAKHPGLPGAGSVRHAVLNHAHGPVVTIPSG